MAKFITGNDLEKVITDIIWEAKETLLIVSPFIKLDQFFKDNFKHHINNYELHLLIVFGKNEADVSKSLNKGDFEFFKSFTNVSIIYEPKLHAKYYGNEAKGVITSVNLYDASFKNNIEFGVFSEQSLLSQFTKSQSADQDAWDMCNEIARKGEAVFIKRPVYKKGLIIGKKYVTSKTFLDNTESFYTPYHKRSTTGKHLADFKDYYLEDDIAEVRPTREQVQEPKKYQAKEVTDTFDNVMRENTFKYNAKKNLGYCIRTGVNIPFDIKHPFSPEAYNSWSRFGNPDYREKYCHFSGEESNGETSFNKPILNKYWKKAQELHS